MYCGLNDYVVCSDFLFVLGGSLIEVCLALCSDYKVGFTVQFKSYFSSSGRVKALRV